MQEESNPRLLTQSQEAACRYVLTQDDDALDHLRAICWKAIHPLFIPNEFSDYKFVREIHKVDGDGRSYSTVKTEYDSSSSETRDFIDMFVRQDLAPFVGKPVDDDCLKWFQHIGRRCRFALVDRLRESGKLTDDGTIECRVSASHGYQEDDGGNLSDYIVAARNNNPIRPEDWIWSQKADLDLLDPLLYTGFKAFFDAYAASETAKGDVTLRLSDGLGISVRQARTYKNRFLNLVRGKYRDNGIIREAYDVVLTFSLRSSATECLVSESPYSKAKRQLLSEAGKEMAEFLAWAGHSSPVKKAIREADYAYSEHPEDRQLTPEDANYARAINSGGSPSEALADDEAVKLIASETVYDAGDLNCYENG